ncbi:MAG: hypothetical protein ACREHD_09495, partial [Pirellulales bacterium]
MRAIKPDVVVKGGTYSSDGVVGREVVQEYGGAVHIAGLTTGVSTTQLAAKLREAASGSIPAVPKEKPEPAPTQHAATNGRVDICVHLGQRTGFRDCATCEGNVRQKVFACNHPNHTDTTLTDCKKCPDFTARSHATELHISPVMAKANGLLAEANGEAATADVATAVAEARGTIDDQIPVEFAAPRRPAAAD